ncbi:hypothetical protein [Streptomyces mirabilis]|uniref:hypothetical protein n=1 Tax=Streptomyces mirabilis TaxID=68239 RepID=UPI0031BA8502
MTSLISRRDPLPGDGDLFGLRVGFELGELIGGQTEPLADGLHLFEEFGGDRHDVGSFALAGAGSGVAAGGWATWRRATSTTAERARTA